MKTLGLIDKLPDFEVLDSEGEDILTNTIKKIIYLMNYQQWIY